MKVTIDYKHIKEMLKLSKAKYFTVTYDGKLVYIITSTCGEITFTTQIVKKVFPNSGDNEVGEVTIPSKTLKAMECNGEITITENKIVSGSKQVAYLRETQISKPIIVENNVMTIGNDHFRELLACSYCMATDDARPTLKGIGVNKDGFAGLDGYRASIRNCNLNVAQDFIIPSEVVAIVKNIKSKCPVNIYINNVYIKLEYDDIEVVGNAILGDFIKVKSLIPVESTSKVKINPEQLIEILKPYSKKATKNKPCDIATFTFQDGSMDISINDEGTHVTDCCCCTLEGKELTISFNVYYLVEALSIYKKRYAYLNMTNRVSLVAVSDVYNFSDSNTNIELVLPVRLAQ